MKTIMTGIGLLLISLSFFATAAYDKNIANENVKSAKILVEKTSTNLLNDLEQNKANLSDRDHLKKLIEKNVLPVTDLETVALRIVGSYWSSLSAEQQGQLKNALANLIINSYATALASYKDEKVVIEDGSTSPDNHDNIRINSRIEGSSASLKVVYYLRKKEDSIGIYDINVNGQQFSASYKSSLAPSVAKKDFKGLMDYLAKQGG